MRVRVFYVLSLFFATDLVASGGRLVVEPGQINDFQCEARFDGEKARFVFGDQSQLFGEKVVWNNGSDSAFEYAWVVYFDGQCNVRSRSFMGCDIGARFFNREGERTKGSLIDLLNQVESFGFLYDENYFEPHYFSPNSLAVSLEDDDVVLTLQHDRLSSHVMDFQGKPANFWVLTKDFSRSCKTTFEILE